MTTGEKACDWWSVLLGDEELFTDVQLPAHITDQQFVSLLQKIGEVVESLDCSECCQLSQEAFISIARTPVTLPRLRHLALPTELVLPNAVFETLANSSCLPQLHCIDNIQPRAGLCDPLRCQAYFRRSALRVVNDSPVTSYGRARRLLLTDSSDHKQRRQRWEADLAKVAISCTHVDTYRCCRGVGYMDDKSVERLSVLFPRLTDVELRLCSVSDDGLLSLCRHNQRAGGLTRLTLDHAGHITDTALTSLADHCPALQHFTLARCPRITNSALRHVLSKCRQLSELSVDLSEAVDVDSLFAVSQHSLQLQVLRLYDVTDPAGDGLNAIWCNCRRLRSVTLRGHLNDTSLLIMSQRCRHLAELSITSDELSLNGLISAMMRANQLRSLRVHGNAHLQVAVDVRVVAEQTYLLLSDDVTCRASAVRSLVLTCCSCDVVLLLTALCSQLLHLQLIHCTQEGSDWTETLSSVLDNCPQLRTLDVSSVEWSVSESLVAELCERAVELRHLSLSVNTSVVSSDVLTALVRVCPSLCRLSFTCSAPADDSVDALAAALVDAVKQHHAGVCHRRDVIVNTAADTFCQRRQLQLSFTPLKLLTALASCPYFTT